MCAVHDALDYAEEAAVQLSNGGCFFVLLNESFSLKHVSEALEVALANHLLVHQTNQFSFVGDLYLHDIVLGPQELYGLVNGSGTGWGAFDELKMLEVADLQFFLRMLVLLVDLEIKGDKFGVGI